MPFISKRIKLILLVLLSVGRVYGQANLFDAQHRSSYAQHLYNNGLYELAIPEYLQVLQTDTNRQNMLLLMQCYRFAHQTPKAKQWADCHFKHKPLPHPICNEYAIGLAETGLYDTLAAAHFWANSADTLAIKQLKISSLLFKAQYKKAQQQTATNAAFVPYQSIAAEGLRLKSKKVWVARGLSVVVPGAGKVYAGQWKDGLITLATVGVMGWQAQRGFAAKGTHSVYGWITGTMGFGYYLGGIYGAGRAARVQNARVHQPIKEKTLQILREKIEVRP